MHVPTSNSPVPPTQPHRPAYPNRLNFAAESMPVLLQAFRLHLAQICCDCLAAGDVERKWGAGATSRPEACWCPEDPLSRGSAQIARLVGAGFKPALFRQRHRSRDIVRVIRPPRRIIRDVIANAIQCFLVAMTEGRVSNPPLHAVIPYAL